MNEKIAAILSRRPSDIATKVSVPSAFENAFANDPAEALDPTQPATEFSTGTPAPGMTRIRFFKIWSTDPAKYDALLGAYNQAPAMPLIQIPRTAVGFCDKVEVIDTDVPSSEVEQAQGEPILRGDGIRILRRPTEAVIVLPLGIPAPMPNIENPTSHLSGGNTSSSISFVDPLTDRQLEEAKELINGL